MLLVCFKGGKESKRCFRYFNEGCDEMCEITLVPTGNIIKEYLDEYGIMEKELAEKISCNEKYILDVLNGNARLTEEFACGLEKVLPGVPKSYWLNYEAKYRNQLAQKDDFLKK